MALLRDAEDGRWWAFRDPSGAVEAFTWPVGDLQVMAAQVEGVPTSLLPRHLGLDWNVIADFLRRPAAIVGQCALRGIEALAPGDLQPLGASPAETVAIWRPRDWLPVSSRIDPGWPAQLVEVVRSATVGLSEPYSRMASEISGGLDSSLVNAALGDAGIGSRVAAALHYEGDGGQSDERRWAEMLCERWALPLVCLPRAFSPFEPDADFADLARGVRPPYAALDAARDRETAAQLEAFGAQALVTGKGGDAVFFQMPTAAVLSDLWRDHGRSALRHPLNGATARWLRRSQWSVWQEAGRRRSRTPPPPAVGRFAGRVLWEAVAGASHPWLEDLEDAPRGKRVQIHALVGTHQVLGPRRLKETSDLVQPLMAQPVMELCLSIPTWELVRGGRDRGLARDAFAHWLPDAVANRRSKGALTSIYSRRAAASLDALRAHLLDGVLASAGLLNRAEIEAALDPDQLIWRADGLDLIMAAAVESWVRYWQTRIPDSADAPRGQAA